MLDKDLINKVLWLTIEDHVGLWEIVWELNSLSPKNSPEQNKEMAKNLLSFLLKQGLVDLYSAKWGGEDLEKIDSQEVEKIIGQDTFWEAPGFDNFCIKAGSTEKGEGYYHEGSIV